MKRFFRILAYVIIIPILLIAIGFFLKTIQVCPDHAILIVNEKTKEYFAPPCLMETGYDNVGTIYKFAYSNSLTVCRGKDIVNKKLKPNPECRDKDGLVDNGGSLSRLLFNKLGLMSAYKNRWNSDGSWNR